MKEFLIAFHKIWILKDSYIVCIYYICVHFFLQKQKLLFFNCFIFHIQKINNTNLNCIVLFLNKLELFSDVGERTEIKNHPDVYTSNAPLAILNIHTFVT